MTNSIARALLPLVLLILAQPAHAQYRPTPPRGFSFPTAPRTETAEPGPTAFTAKPSQALLKELHRRLAAIEPYSAANKLSRVEMAARIIQVDLALREKGSGDFNLSDIQPEEAADVYDVLAETPLKDLGDLTNPATRAVLWSAIGSAHPLYRLYVEGVRLADHTDDPRVLDRTLRILKEVWQKPAKTSAVEVSTQVFDEPMREVLLEMLRFQSVTGLEDAARLMRDYNVVPQAQLHRKPGPTDPPAREPRALHTARIAGGLDQYDKLAHLGAALQRSGFEVTFWSLAVFQAVDEETKTLVDEPLLVFPARPDEPARIAMGDDGLLAPLGGEELAPGVYLFPSEEPLQALVVRRGQMRVAMGDVLEGQASLIAWSEGLQKGLERTKEDFELRRGLLELSTPAPWSSFKNLANLNLLEQAQARFIEQMQRNRARLQINDVLADELVTGKWVEELTGRGEKEMLAKHEAVMGRAFQILPQKMSPGIAIVTLQTKPVKEKISTAVFADGKLTVKEVERAIPGRAWPHRIYLASPTLSHAIHENMHAWALARHERFENGEWRGTAIEPFNNICWEQDGGRAWKRRESERFRLEDFLWDYGATNHNEDLAVVGQYYVLYPEHFRETARTQLKNGNFAPFVKYIFLKYVAFLDNDGRSLEYGLNSAEAAMTFAEFEERILAYQRVEGGLTEEQLRLANLARLIYEISNAMLEGQRIVSVPDIGI